MTIVGLNEGAIAHFLPTGSADHDSDFCNRAQAGAILISPLLPVGYPGISVAVNCNVPGERRLIGWSGVVFSDSLSSYSIDPDQGASNSTRRITCNTNEVKGR